MPWTAFSLSICHKVLAADKAIAVLDASADADFASAKTIVALDIKTVMGTPLVAKGKRLGVLYVDSQAVVSTFTEKDDNTYSNIYWLMFLRIPSTTYCLHYAVLLCILHIMTKQLTICQDINKIIHCE